jgi:NADH-quinone oxidoreductase subunit H
MMEFGELLLWSLVKFFAIVFGFVMVVATVLTLMERKQSAYMQNRVGPNRALLFGKKFPLSAFIGQILADALKVLTKEDFEPPHGNKWLHRIAPGLALLPAWLMWLVIPFGPGPVPGAEGHHLFQIANLNVGVLFVFAIASLSVYGATIGAWASNSAFSLLGGLRTAAQMISYEVTLGLNLVGVFMIFGSMRLNDIIWGQGELAWGIVMQPVAFILFMVAAIAETKRAPFDLPEAESELAAGYFTEYSSMRFAVFSLGEFIGIVLVAALAACVFLGGWQIPWVDTPVDANGIPVYGWITVAQVACFLLKTLVLVGLQMQIRWTLPRFRYDQLMKLGWVYLLPLSILNLVGTAVVMYLVR